MTQRNIHRSFAYALALTGGARASVVDVGKKRLPSSLILVVVILITSLTGAG